MPVKKKILIIDQDTKLAELYKLKFASDGFKCQIAENLLKAVELVNHLKPHIILLDLMTTNNCDGLIILEKIKKNPNLADVSVIVFTALPSKKIEQKALELGAKKYLIKSRVTPSQVAEVVKNS